MRAGTIGDGLSGPSAIVDWRDKEDLERAFKVCRLFGDISGGREAVPVRPGPGDGGGLMVDVVFSGLADLDEVSVDLADEVRVMLGAFL